MIVVEVKLASAIDRSRDTELGTMIIGNVGTCADGRTGNYTCYMYPKGALKRSGGDARKMVRSAKPTRTGFVDGHRRLAEPVHNLVAKALASMGYK